MSSKNKKITDNTKTRELITLDEEKRLNKIINEGSLVGLMEFITGIAGTKKSELFMSAGRISQAFIKGKLCKQLFVEVQELRKKGKINEEYINSEYGKKTFADILRLIDEENLDPKKWEAIKNVFYSSISKDTHEKYRARSYYIMQICLQLDAFDFEVLSICFSIYKTPDHAYQGLKAADQWVEVVSDKLGYGLPEFVEQSEERLTKLGLLGGRTHGDRSGIHSGANFRLTKLGIALCEITNTS